jgi:hypothetical protein
MVSEIYRKSTSASGITSFKLSKGRVMHVAHVYARLAKHAAEESSEAHYRERGQSIEERVLEGYVFELCHRRPIQRYVMR